MMHARVLLLGTVILAFLLASIPIGRWERDTAFETENAGIAAVYAAIGPRLAASSLSSYRVDASVACLIYEQGSELYALEICVDGQGRVVEAVDRRRGEPEFWSLAFAPSAVHLRVDTNAVRRAIQRLAPSERNFGPLGG
jgi:hypothetical protein